MTPAPPRVRALTAAWLAYREAGQVPPALIEGERFAFWTGAVAMFAILADIEAFSDGPASPAFNDLVAEMTVFTDGIHAAAEPFRH